jgi:branched-chain amino acid transport system permease protein
MSDQPQEAPESTPEPTAETEADAIARGLRLLPDTTSRVLLVASIATVALLPFFVSSDFWMTVLGAAGVFALAGLGLNLLTGYAGQVSLGQAAFVLIGAYVAAYFGADQGWPMFWWMLAATLVGGLIGAAIGPFALRFKGNYLVVVTLALVFVTVHVLRNWESFSGGLDGKSVSDASLWFIVDFGSLSLFGKEFTRLQGIFYLTWIIVGLATLAVANIVRTRPGRALQAIRDRDIAAEVIGVRVARNKIIVFALSSAMAGMAGGLDAVRTRFLTPGVAEAELLESIRYIAVIVVGGIGTVTGAIVGALFLGPLPELIEQYSDTINFTVPFLDQPLLKDSATADGIMTTAVLSEILFGVLLVVFLMFQPRGLVGMFGNARRWLAAKRHRSPHEPSSTGD